MITYIYGHSKVRVQGGKRQYHTLMTHISQHQWAPPTPLGGPSTLKAGFLLMHWFLFHLHQTLVHLDRLTRIECRAMHLPVYLHLQARYGVCLVRCHILLPLYVACLMVVQPFHMPGLVFHLACLLLCLTLHLLALLHLGELRMCYMLHNIVWHAF